MERTENVKNTKIRMTGGSLMNKEPKANGRPLTEIDWDEFGKLCMMLCTQVEIADWFGCTDDTIQAASS